MPIIAIEAILKITMYIVQWIVEKKANDKALSEAFQKFSELARTENIKAIIERNKAQDQYQAGSDKWDELEKQEREQNGSKKPTA